MVRVSVGCDCHDTGTFHVESPDPITATEARAYVEWYLKPEYRAKVFTSIPGFESYAEYISGHYRHWAVETVEKTEWELAR